MQHILDLYNRLEDCANAERAQPPLSFSQTREIYRERGEPGVRPVAIPEMGGRIRVASLHPVEEVLTARAITGKMLAALKGWVTTRAMLRAEEVRLQPSSPQAKLFSADLSKATDYIGHRLAQRVGAMLCEKLGLTDDLDDLTRILGPKLTDDGDYTKSGVHMGLGPSWIILSILNSYAAWKAGVNKDTYAVCGDDLIGYWTKAQTEKYAKTLTELGLVVNQDKSFFGRRGVFCERIVTPRGQLGHAPAVADDIGHFGAIFASKLTARRTKCAMAVADSMADDKSLPASSDAVRRGLLPRHRMGGRVRHGGNGFGRLPLNMLASLVTQGSVQMSSDGIDLPRDFRELAEAATLKCPPGGVDIKDVAIELRSALRYRAALEGSVPEPTATDESAHIRAAKRRARAGVRDLPALIRHSSLPSRARHIALRLLRGDLGRSQNRRRRRLENVLSRPHATRYVESQLATELILSHAPTGWVFRSPSLRRAPRPKSSSDDGTGSGLSS